MMAVILCVYYLEKLMCLVVWYVCCEGDVCNYCYSASSYSIISLLYVVCGEICKVCYYSKVLSLT